MRRYSSVIFATIIAIFSIFSIVFVYQTLVTFKKYVIDFQIGELSRFSKILEHSIKNYEFEPSASIHNSLKELSRYYDSILNLRITIIDTSGKVVADSRQSEEKLDNHRNRPEVSMAFDKGEGYSVRYSTTLKAEYIYFARRILLKNGEKLLLRVSVPKESLSLFFVDIQEKVIGIFLVLFAVIAVLTFLLSRALTKPILEVIEASKKVAAGSFDVHLDERGDSEVAILKRNFNEMVSELKRSMEKIVHSRNFMNNMINSLDQALAIFDEKCNIVFSNKSYNVLLESETPCSIESVRFDAIRKQIIDSIENRKDTTIEVEIEKKVFLSSVKHIPEANQVLHLLYDISIVKKVENIKKDLVANVSHELRTPLTAIKGYIETIEDEIPNEQKRYVETIKKNTERIIHIVDDLLSLVTLEDKSAKLYISDVDVYELIQQIIPTFKQRLEEKGLKIEVISENDFPVIKADGFRLEQVFVNLIDNAIKYSERGTIRIELLRNDEESVKIIVSDEGIGIPKEHQERIFERFYTVDKSHSRRYGGTGLGLSIVKHIILLHDGNIQVESEKGTGTRFIIYLPVS
jgi:two-component system phosphate regulon sensor histidine kinase PhoR